MLRKHFVYYLQHLKHDVPAGIVVFLVALPLCLGIALASGAPLLSGLIAGIVGGLIVSWASGSQLSISGPAAGLTVIVLQGIENLGSFETFLVAVCLAGIIQLSLGFLKAGTISAYFPVSVIKGMLSAIGLILIIKQLPHAVGFDGDLMGEETYEPQSVTEAFSKLLQSMASVSLGSTVISVVSILIMLAWESHLICSIPVLGLIPGALVAVLWGIIFQVLSQGTPLAIAGEHLVRIPDMQGLTDLIGNLRFPDFSELSNPTVYILAATLAIVASLETLLTLEAIDKLDPLKRVAPTNRELKAQGLGNLISGLLGGLPITAVIVRSAANVNAGARTKISSFVHGVFLLLGVSFFARFLNHIPLSALSAILLLIGYKLVKPSIGLALYRKGTSQFVPYLVTVGSILMTDLLKGIAIGMVCGLYYVIKANFHGAITLTQHGNYYLLGLRNHVSFLNKALLRELLASIEPRSELIIDGVQAQFVDHDIVEMIEDFIKAAPNDEIVVHVRHIKGLSSTSTPARTLENSPETTVALGSL